MATYEQSGILTFKNDSGDLYRMYPVTKKENVSGMDDIDAHIIDTNNPHNVTAAQIGAASSTPVTATSADGVAYTATVDGIDSLYIGANFIMIPNTDSTSQSVTLNVNGLGAKNLRRKVSAGSSVTASGYTNDWLAANKPVRVMYDGLFWTVDIVQAHASDLMGSVPITKGGTGATDGSTGLANLLAAGNMVLSAYQYGDTLPASGTSGRVFFKKITDDIASGGSGSSGAGSISIDETLTESGKAADAKATGDAINSLSEEIANIPSGADGKSAYDYAVEGGYTGTEEEFSAKLADAANVSVDTIPEYIQTAAAAIAKTVNRRQTENSVCFAFMTDAHLGYYTDLENVAGKHAGQALKVINNRCLLDFVVHGGDYTTGAWNTTVDATFEDMEDYLELIGSVTDVPQVWCIGNHDDAPYQATADRLSQTQSFAMVGRKNRVSNAACNPGCNYGYLDLDSQKVRIIYLDTHDKRSWGTVAVGAGETAPDFLYADNIGGEQLKFLADTALDFSAKADPSEWAVIAVSHAVLNGSGTCTDAVSGESHDTNTANAALILSAYQNGGSGSVTNNGVTAEYDFSALESRAAVICCVHGNDHKYADEMVGNGILSICCPNICNGRERESADGNTYTKTEGTAEGTSFCIITVDRVNQKIYADHYGAGIDREYDYTISAPVGYTNQIPISTDANGSIYNGVGYKSGYRLGSSGTDTSMDGMYVTGFIPCKTGDIIRLQNLTFQYGVSTSSNQRFSIYDSAKNHIAQANATSIKANCNAIVDESGVYTQFTINSFTSFDTTTAAYFRLNGTYIGDDSVITVNEEIV